MYLPESTIRSIFSEIHSETATGSYLVFDYLTPKNIDANNKLGNNFVKKIDEEYIFGIIPEELPDYVSPLGYETIENLTSLYLNQRFLSEVRSRYLRNALSPTISPNLAFLKTT